MKKLLAAIVLLIMIAIVWQSYRYYQQKQTERILRQNAKAEQIKLTFIEGWTAKEMADYLEKQQLVKASDFFAAEKDFTANDYDILKYKPASAGLEGFLFPDTYLILRPKNNFDPATAKVVISKMLENFDNKFTPVMKERAAADNMSVYQIITLASIIEKEAGGSNLSASDLDAQRKIISGIFYNRLRLDMPLQSDATVNFITGKKTPGVSLDDTKINSPYNTYLYKGLPPGPIGNPSLSSLMAALYPATTDYLYFQHNQKTGEVIYSKTLQQHDQSK